jgi:hypothetical protein
MHAGAGPTPVQPVFRHVRGITGGVGLVSVFRSDELPNLVHDGAAAEAIAAVMARGVTDRAVAPLDHEWKAPWHQR